MPLPAKPRRRWRRARRIDGRSGGFLVGRVYRIEGTSGGEPRLELAEVELGGVELVDGELKGHHVSVESRCVLAERGPSGELFGRSMESLVARNGRLCFQPSGGGVRTRENRLAAGAFNDDVAEAARFGIVNAFFHVVQAAAYVAGLLRELGADPLPPMHVVVCAHSGSRLPGFGEGDGDFRKGRLHPLHGGHYRLSTLTTGVPEPVPVRPTGEIHLGPGRLRGPFAGEESYLPNAAHNPATIYHEYGHHLCRHTADFRLNGERAPEAQRNGKTGPEEGVCDYLTASLLGTGQPYSWYRAARGRRRDPAVRRPAPPPGENDAHALGAQWASVFWRTREELLQAGLVDSPRDHDRVFLQTLLELGTVACRPGDRRRRRERAADRNAPGTVTSTYLDVLGAAAGTRAVRVASDLFKSERLAKAAPC